MNTENKLKPSDLLEGLSHFHGSDVIYKVSPLFPGFCMTEGIRYLRKEAECHWLIDDIAALQLHPKIKTHPKLQQTQFWSLIAASDESAVLKCEWDIGKVVYRQKITWTDFPLDSIRIWVANGFFSSGAPYRLAYLPSEH